MAMSHIRRWIRVRVRVRVRVSRGYILLIGAVRAITDSWTYALGDNLI